MGGSRMEQRMRVELAMTAMSAREDQRLMGAEWVMRGFLQGEVQGMEGVQRDGGESILAEVRQSASLLRGYGGTGRHQSEKPPGTEAANTSRRQRLSIIGSVYLGSRSQPTPISLVSKAIRGLFCVDIKYFSLSSNSLF